MNKMRIIKWIALIFGIWLVFLAALNLTFRPSHDRIWEPGHEALPHINIEDGLVTITNYRHLKSTRALKPTRNYETKSFPISDITGVSVLRGAGPLEVAVVGNGYQTIFNIDVWQSL